MLALVEAHPNIDMMVFYALATAILAGTLYYYPHQAGSQPRDGIAAASALRAARG